MYFSDIVNNKIIVFLKMSRKFGVVYRFFIFFAGWNREVVTLGFDKIYFTFV
ncbi:hypothetical protein LEP1GSC048_2897 [Leptospira santarosai serovar Shermani str. 1342KT]|nr:hypothetical protein LEP1GSC048_2897 [Leptospira santarosai serovar Shermani str. 1342KT]